MVSDGLRLCVTCHPEGPWRLAPLSLLAAALDCTRIDPRGWRRGRLPAGWTLIAVRADGYRQPLYGACLIAGGRVRASGRDRFARVLAAVRAGEPVRPQCGWLTRPRLVLGCLHDFGRPRPGGTRWALSGSFIPLDPEVPVGADARAVPVVEFLRGLSR